MADHLEVICRLNSTALGCPLHHTRRLCTKLRPPDFPPWLNESEKESYKQDCSSWRAYEEICIYGRGSFVHYEESMDVASRWIFPGIFLSAAAVLVAGIIIAFIWFKKQRAKYAVDTQLYVDYNYLHHKAEQKVKWNGKDSPDSVDIKNNTHSDIIDPEVPEIKNCEPLELNVRSLIKDATVDECVKVLPPKKEVLEKVVSYDVCSCPDMEPELTLPNVVPFQMKPVECENANSSALLNSNGSPALVGQTDQVTASGEIKGRVYEVGYVNPAYDGSDTLKEGRSPKKRKKKMNSKLINKEHKNSVET